MNETINYNYGVDLNSNFEFQDGDLQLIKYEDNLGQAIANRLNTIQDSLDIFYYDYGSLFMNFLGWRRRQSTLDLMKVELDRTLEQEPRIINFETEIEFGENKTIQIKIIIYDYNDAEIELNFILGENGVEIVEEDE